MRPFQPRPARHRYPSIRAGGVFAVLAGITTLAATWLGGDNGLQPAVFIAGFLLSVVIGMVLLRRPLSFGDERISQRLAELASIAFVALALTVVGGFFRQGDPRTYELAILLVVGLMLIILSITYGPLAGLLGLLCSASAAAGIWLLPQLAFPLFGAIDGLLKLGFGAGMLAARPTAPPAAAPSEQTL